MRRSSDLITLTKEQLAEFGQTCGRAAAAEMLAKLRAEGRLVPQETMTATIGRLVVDFAGHEASIDGEQLQMQPREFAVLAALSRHVGQVLTRDRLLELVHPDPAALDSERSVDVYVRRLRKALGEHAGMIETIVGSGYKLTRPQPGHDVSEGKARIIGEFVQDGGVATLRTSDGREYKVLPKRYPLVADMDADGRLREAAIMFDVAADRGSGEPKYLARSVDADQIERLAQAGKVELQPGVEVRGGPEPPEEALEQRRSQSRRLRR